MTEFKTYTLKLNAVKLTQENIEEVIKEINSSIIDYECTKIKDGLYIDDGELFMKVKFGDMIVKDGDFFTPLRKELFEQIYGVEV